MTIQNSLAGASVMVFHPQTNNKVNCAAIKNSYSYSCKIHSSTIRIDLQRPTFWIPSTILFPFISLFFSVSCVLLKVITFNTSSSNIACYFSNICISKVKSGNVQSHCIQKDKMSYYFIHQTKAYLSNYSQRSAGW